MSANAQLGQQEEPFDPALLMAGVEMCSEALAIAESGHLLYANRAFKKTRGVVEGLKLRGQLLTDLLPKNTRYLAPGDGYYSGDGPVQLEATTSDFHQDQRAFQVICIRSVHPANSVEALPWESRKLQDIGRLSAGVAHDFNNLLTGILLYSDLLMEGLGVKSRFRRHAEAIHKASTDGVSLVQQLMIPSGEEPFQSEPVSWNQIASGMTSLLNRLVGEDIEIGTSFFEPLGQVRIDPSQVRRIILNLVLNARYAMPMGGKVVLSTRNSTSTLKNSEGKRPGAIPCIEFSVTDTGTGMDKETLARVFRPFFTTKPRSQGNGLGLTVVHDLVKQAGGEVEIESELGKGTRVIIRIPLIEGLEGNRGQVLKESC